MTAAAERTVHIDAVGLDVQRFDCLGEQNGGMRIVVAHFVPPD